MVKKNKEEVKLDRILQEQMGIDSKDCDPVTLDLFRSKFFGGSSSTGDIKTKKERKEVKGEK